MLDAYVEAGGNFVDTADVYSAWVEGNRGGESERMLGEWLASRGLRGEVIVATKVGSGAEELERGLTREHVIRGCEASLRRLGLETIDLFYAHNDHETPPLEETLAAFDELVRSGKVRHLGASNYRAPRLRLALELSAAAGLAPYDACSRASTSSTAPTSTASSRRCACSTTSAWPATRASRAASSRASTVRARRCPPGRARRASRPGIWATSGPRRAGGRGRGRRREGRARGAGGPRLGARPARGELGDRERDDSGSARRAARRRDAELTTDELAALDRATAP